MKRLLSLLLTAALLLSLLAVCGSAAKADANDPCVLARQYATRITHDMKLPAATRGAGDSVAIPSVDMDGQTFLVGTTAELELGTYGRHLYQSFKVEIYKGSNINKIKDSDYVWGWTGGIRDGAYTHTMDWDTTGQAAGDYLFVTMIYDSETRTYLSDSFYYAKFTLVKSPIALNYITLRDAGTDAAVTGWKTLEMGSELSFYTVFNPANATGSREKTIVSDNPNVVQISNFGGIITVTPQLPGKTTITVTANGKSAYFGVEVPGAITLKLSRTYQSVLMGWRHYLTATVTPQSVLNYSSFRWSSDNPSIATVDSTGMVTAISPGLTTVRCAINYNGMTASAACTISVPADDDPCKYYEDVNRGQWYHEGIDFVLANGLMSSTYTMSYIFEPSTKLTRAMVATILYRMAGSPEMSGTYAGTFTDVKEGQWYTPTVEWCAANGLASGKGDGRFDPNGKVTRQELAIFMYRLAEYLKQDVSGSADLDGFADAASVPAWAESFVKWAVSAGLISGKANGDKLFLAPADTASRAEFACIAKSMMEGLTDPVVDPDPTEEPDPTEDTDPTEELPPVEDPNPVTKP